MSKVAIVTDSTATLPVNLLKNYPVYTIPLQVIWDGKSYRDSVDIQPKDFYERLSTSKTMPTTSQPTPADFHALYLRLIEEGYDILNILISSKLSGTMDSAIQARAMLPGPRIAIVDSETTSMAMGFQIAAVARAAAQGATLEECQKLAENAREHTGVLFALKTLEFLHRGGRIGGAAAFLGTALNLKPILEIKAGRIEAVERVRTTSKAIDRLLDLFEMRIQRRTPVRLAALHTNAPEDAQQLLERARERFKLTDVEDALITDVSPVLGTHTGPGCVGLAFMAGM